MPLRKHTRSGRHPWVVLLAFTALTLLVPALSSTASAKRVVLQRGSAKTSAAMMHRSPMQQKLTAQRVRARLKTSQRSPRSLRMNLRQSSSNAAGRVVARRGPLRKRALRRAQFSRRAKRKSRSIDGFGRWTRPDRYSLR